MGAWKEVIKNKAPKPVMPVVRRARNQARVASQMQANKVASTQIATNRSRSANTAAGAVAWSKEAKRRAGG